MPGRNARVATTLSAIVPSVYNAHYRVVLMAVGSLRSAPHRSSVFIAVLAVAACDEGGVQTPTRGR
jgi:hypothetical protein